MIPAWLHDISVFALGLGFVCAAVIAVDEVNHPQQMWIMNVVWPLTALFAGPLSAWGYFRYGRIRASGASTGEHENAGGEDVPFSVSVAKGAAHCGSGCTLGDIIAEWLVFFIPTIAVWFGYRSIFSEKIFATWLFDYVLAFAFGIMFQYYTIAPMRGLSFGKGIVAALKADVLSLTAWQVGMYGFMALANFWIFRSVLNVPLEVDSVEFWFMMQLAMLCGFATSYPVNWWLIRSGIKERM